MIPNRDKHYETGTYEHPRLVGRIECKMREGERGGVKGVR